MCQSLDTFRLPRKLLVDRRPRALGRRPKVSPSEAHSIGHPAPAWCLVQFASLVSRSGDLFSFGRAETTLSEAQNAESKGVSFLSLLMALTKDQKQAQVKDLTQKLKDSESVMFAHYIGMSVLEVSELRNKLKESEAEMKVAKKTLMKIAAKDSGLPELSDDAVEGPVACIFSFADPLSGAQVAFKFAKDHPQVELIGGVFEGKLLSKEEAIELAKMPSRDQLLAMFATMIRSPLVNFAGICSSPLSGFARALSEMADKGGLVKDEAPKAEPIAEPATDEKKDEPATKEPAEEKKEEEDASAEDEAKADAPEPAAESPDTPEEPPKDEEKPAES